MCFSKPAATATSTETGSTQIAENIISFNYYIFKFNYIFKFVLFQACRDGDLDGDGEHVHEGVRVHRSVNII